MLAVMSQHEYLFVIYGHECKVSQTIGMMFSVNVKFLGCQ